MAITIDEQGNYVDMERFAPNYHPRQPIDIKFGPTGDLYVLEYGGNTANSPVESQLVRVEYNAGNRKPAVQIKFDKRGGSIPLTIQLSSDETVDYDGDVISYQWKISSGNKSFESKEKNPQFTLDQEGIYTATLTVTDSKKLSNSASVQIIAGNDPPNIELAISGNQNFFSRSAANIIELLINTSGLKIIQFSNIPCHTLFPIEWVIKVTGASVCLAFK